MDLPDLPPTVARPISRPNLLRHRGDQVSTEHRACARGCTVWNRHLAACEDRDECRGCQPRDAEYGNLCFGCHKRLTNLLEVAPWQVALLTFMAGHRGEVELSALTTAAPPLKWRVDSDEVLRTLYAKPTESAFGSSEPYRLAVVDAEREIQDRLDLWAVHLVNDYQQAGPEGHDVTGTAAWLRVHIERLEYREGIGDELEKFMSIMSSAHSLAPWREQVARLRGIPCPECHTTTLVMFGEDDFVSCLRCKATMSHERYGIWTRILAEEQRRKGMAG